MDYAILIAVVSAIAALASAVFAAFAWQVAKTTLSNQTLLDLQKEYRTSKMLHAVRTLWDFYREHGRDKFVEKYKEIYNEEKKWISSLEKQKRIEAEESTLHYQRRLTSQFYLQLATLCANGVVPKKMVYRIWGEADLRIIPEILVPIENRLREVLHRPPLGPLDENNDLIVLYRNSKDR